MRNTTVLLVAFFLLGVQALFSQSIATDIRPTDSHTQLGMEFTSAVLSYSQLQGFERRALQKLDDVEGYLAILGNPFYEDEFRSQAKEMLRKSFRAGSLKLWHPYSIGSLGFEAFADFFGSMTEERYFNIQFSEAEAVEDLVLQEEGYYEGAVKFYFSMSLLSSRPHRAEGKSMWYRIGYRVQRVTKSFGGTEKMVWTVRLGDLEKN